MRLSVTLLYAPAACRTFSNIQVSLLLALAVVMGTTEIIGNKARTSAENSLEEQIKRHLKNASTEAAATIGEKFRRLQYGVLNVTSYGLRDALQEVSLSAIHGGCVCSLSRPVSLLGKFLHCNVKLAHVQNQYEFRGRLSHVRCTTCRTCCIHSGTVVDTWYLTATGSHLVRATAVLAVLMPRYRSGGLPARNYVPVNIRVCTRIREVVMYDIMLTPF